MEPNAYVMHIDETVMDKYAFLGTKNQKGLFLLKITKILDKGEYTVFNFVSKDGRKSYTFMKHGLQETCGLLNRVNNECLVVSAIPMEHGINNYNQRPETKFGLMKVVKSLGMSEIDDVF